jgi:hypothetical protein
LNGNGEKNAPPSWKRTRVRVKDYGGSVVYFFNDFSGILGGWKSKRLLAIREGKS